MSERMSENIFGGVPLVFSDGIERGARLEMREEIVRCRDCEHYDPHPTDSGVCFLPDGDGDFARWEVEPDGFCKWGERRSE